ncbi:tRNA-dihydrouridine synthase [Endozoicomonas sp. G2_1]|uniref:tRNA-dihydrouridine synthase n=1 Tax=Endozoicomonas sp. G2_1 TaxID=2821091 RepID=UPI001ADD34CD|nr:tRNA-dihydrouridine synthase [Endozoicomonas sp. G2_1]MBO9491486.1 tRNA-dihydrouridine synthase [Endozoicomonas sp. G2_1]
MNTQVKKIVLAPMEGVVDRLMRELLTSINDYDLCVTEFVRVVNKKMPKHVFYRICPELHNKGYTTSGTPVRVQLLGQMPEIMAANAERALELGSHGVDVNFGCPAKTVNKSKGGAVLLKEPEKIYQILSTIKKSIGTDNTLSAKIRLGFDEDSLFEEIVSAVESSGVKEIAIHARTKRHGYKPPAYWHKIGEIADKHQLSVTANGEIWHRQHMFNCIEQSKTNSIMLGRGALAMPNLANVLRYNEAPMSKASLKDLLITYSERELEGDKSYYFSSRLKQWLRYLKLQFNEAELLFQRIKTLTRKQEIIEQIDKL